VSLKIIAIVPELLVGVRIEEAAKRIGATVASVSSQEAALARLADSGADLIVVDLGVNGLDLAGIVASGRARGATVIAFGPHVDADRRRAAQRAGIERVFARSRFLKALPTVLEDAMRVKPKASRYP